MLAKLELSFWLKSIIDRSCSFHNSSPRSPRSLSEQQFFDLQLIGCFSFEKKIYFRLFGHINPKIVDITFINLSLKDIT